MADQLTYVPSQARGAIAAIIGTLLLGLALMLPAIKDSISPRFPVCPEGSPGYYVPYGAERSGKYWSRYECVPPHGLMRCDPDSIYCVPAPAPTEEYRGEGTSA